MGKSKFKNVPRLSVGKAKFKDEDDLFASNWDYKLRI